MNTRFCLKNRLYACLKKCAYNVLCLPFIINANAPANAQSVLKRLTDSIEYRADWTYNISDASERTPFWLSSNRYGLGGVRHSNGHMRWGVFKDEKKDSNATWRMGYGADFVLAHNYTSDFFVQQLYMDLGYKNIIISGIDLTGYTKIHYGFFVFFTIFQLTFDILYRTVPPVFKPW